MPGVIGGLTSAIMASRAPNNFGSNYPIIFGQDLGSNAAGGYQLAALALTLGFSISGGLLAGFITSRQWFQPIPEGKLFDDRHHWFNCEMEHEKLKMLERTVSLHISNSATNIKASLNQVVEHEEEEEQQQLENHESAAV